MRVLVTTKRAPFEGRGAEQIIWRIGTHFAEHGHRVRYFCPTPTTDAEIPDVAGVDFEFVSTSDDPTRSMIAFFLQGPLRYRGAYRSFDPDVVYDNPSPFPFHLAHVYGDSPVISKVHAVYRRLAFACKEHPLVKIGTIFGEETYRLYRGERFVTNSESTAKRLRKLVDTSRNEVVANPIGIDADKFTFNIPKDGNQVLALSKLSPRKGISYLLNAWQKVEIDDSDAELLIAGSGPHEAHLKQLAKELDLRSVSFLGFVSEEEKRTLLRESAIFVNPTLYEGFGLSNLEAMASGCTVVSTDAWGVRDYLVDGENACVVPTRSPNRIHDALIGLFRNGERRKILAQEGQRTTEQYSMQESLDRELFHLTDFTR